MERPASTRVRCPRCRSATLSLVETGEWASIFEVVDGRLDRAGGIHEPGSMTRLDAQCGRCGHGWKIRGAIQITDAVVEDDEIEEKTNGTR